LSECHEYRQIVKKFAENVESPQQLSLVATQNRQFRDNSAVIFAPLPTNRPPRRRCSSNGNGGDDVKALIVNGSPAEVDEFPHMVMMNVIPGRRIMKFR
jgi:hypothetical protein